MHYDGIDAFLRSSAPRSWRGPVAILFLEDEVEIDSTIRHHLDLGFAEIICVVPPALAEIEIAPGPHRILCDFAGPGGFASVVTALMDVLDGRWIYYGFNAEYLFFPFCETRSVGEMLAFHTEERRDAMMCYVVDLYADDLDRHANAVSRETAHFDASGYYALSRRDGDGTVLDRQLDIFGGLRWRFEEHIAESRRRIDRIALFRARKGLRLGPDHLLSEPELNTVSCPWHHNLTAAVASFRTAKALRTNPGSRGDVATFLWANSARFDWRSEQLLKLGLMEPGQWF